MELVADSMLIIDKGKKLVEGKMNELFNPADTVVELKTTNDEYNYELLSKSALASFLVQRRNDCILLKLKRPEAPGMLKNMVEMGD